MENRELTNKLIDMARKKFSDKDRYRLTLLAMATYFGDIDGSNLEKFKAIDEMAALVKEGIVTDFKPEVSGHG